MFLIRKFPQFMSFIAAFFVEPFLFEDILQRRFFAVLIFKQRFAIEIRIFSTASRFMSTFLVIVVVFIKSWIILWMSSDCNVSLNFCDESFSQKNCFGRGVKGSYQVIITVQLYYWLSENPSVKIWSNKFQIVMINYSKLCASL